jgi:hypothetical protein
MQVKVMTTPLVIEYAFPAMFPTPFVPGDWILNPSQTMTDPAWINVLEMRFVGYTTDQVNDQQIAVKRYVVIFVEVSELTLGEYNGMSKSDPARVESGGAGYSYCQNVTR